MFKCRFAFGTWMLIDQHREVIARIPDEKECKNLVKLINKIIKEANQEIKNLEKYLKQLES